MTQSIYGAALDAYRERVRGFFRDYAEPRMAELEREGIDRAFWRAAGTAGILGAVIPREYGGPGLEPIAALVLSEETGRWPGGATIGATMSSDLAATFLVQHGTEAQKRQWFPRLLSGESVLGMALTEAGAGSDAAAITGTAVRDGDHYVINTEKSLVMSGNVADVFIIVVKTDPTAKARGMSMILVPGDAPGLTRQRITTMGFKGGDTAALTLRDVRVPVVNLLGAEGAALRIFQATLALDRLQICARSLGAAQAAFELTLAFCRERRLFGQRLIDFQNTQFALATMETEIAVSRAYLEQLVGKLRDGSFRDEDGAMAKVWIPEMEGRVLDACVQLWGGASFVDANPISRMYTSARPQRIYAGATELMKSLLARRYLGS